MSTCCGIDHHAGTYTPQQQADLDRVLAFNRRMAAGIEAGLDVSPVEKLLDPDPLRYMWVDEGAGRLGEFLARADVALGSAQRLEGYGRVGGATVHDSGTAARPAVAVGPGGEVLHVWIDWHAHAGDQVMAVLHPYDATAHPPRARVGGPEPVALSGAPADCFRPSAVFDAAGRAWVFWARNDGGSVTIHSRRCVDGVWTDEERVGGAEHPSFNQECVAHADGSVEVVWQAPLEQRFRIVRRRWRDGAWGPIEPVSAVDDTGNVWDPAVAARPDGGSVYAWCAYVDGSYRVLERHTDASGGEPSEPRALTGGSDYAMHPSLAVTTGGDVWCAFDVISVAGHGGSGPTRLRAHAELGPVTRHPGTRDSGESVPEELLPDVSASVRVVRVGSSGLFEGAGELAPHLDVVPGGLPRLVAIPGGGLVLAYRIHRRLPLMTYYWEVATQTLGPDGWSLPTTYSGSDGTLEEPALAALAVTEGAMLAWQSDGRLTLGLEWTEGFGGRECPVLLEHHGEVIWHGMHGTGTVRTAVVAGTGPAAPGTRGTDLVVSDERREARTWPGGRRQRYRTSVAGTEYQLYWGDLHRHSLISRCTSGDEPSLEDFYRYSWDVCEYDFWAVTDHSENSTDYQWWSIKKIADLFRVDGRFVPFYGFEWTGLMGHQNVIYGDVARDAPIFSAYAEGSDDPGRLWSQLARYPDHPAITVPHHPGSAMVPYDWDYGDERFLRVVEVFQACRGSYEADGCYRQYSDGTLPGTFVAAGLARGHRFGMIASSDHGHGAAYVGAYAESLDRGAVFDALHSRRCFAATQRDIVLDVRVLDVRIGDAFMGQETVVTGPVELHATVAGYADIARIDVLRDGVLVHSELPALGLAAGWLTVPLRLEWGQADATVDWSGTLTVQGGEILQTPFWSPDVTAADGYTVAWSSVTKSFGHPYGSMRGGVELTVVGPPDAVVTVIVGHGKLRTTVGALADGAVEVPLAGPGRIRLQRGAGGLSSMGTRERTVHWTDPLGGPAYYYVRAFLVDGEMAWSSPIWVDEPR